MATTKIHDIGSDATQCIFYAKNNKVGNFSDGIANSINYAINDKTGEVVYKTLSTYLLCNEDTIINDFKRCMEEGRGSKKREPSRRKDGQEVVCFHLHQNFEGYEVDPVTANEIGRKLAEELLAGYPCVISTHTNTKNLHNHIVFCAWNEDGGKYNDCHSTYRAIRRTSDRLCKEYGLSVLENTKEMKLIKYTDANGKTRYYEPTERKDKIISERKVMGVEGSVGDFKNTSSYDYYADKKENNRDMVKSDIDMFLPTVRSYDELLDRLREIGYVINDKKKNGEWLKHVSFKPSTADKPVRDKNIGLNEEKDFYRRETLTSYIEDRVWEMDNDANKNVQSGSVEIGGLRYFDSYDYPNFNVSDIDDEYRIVKLTNGNFEPARRTSIEKENISIIRGYANEISREFNPLNLVRHIDNIIEQRRIANEMGRKYTPMAKGEVAFENIQNALKSLRFIENNNIYSFAQLNELCSALKMNYERNIAELEKFQELVKYLSDILELPGRAVELSKVISASVGNMEYMMESYSDDMALLSSYREIISKYQIDTEEGITSA